MNSATSICSTVWNGGKSASSNAPTWPPSWPHTARTSTAIDSNRKWLKRGLRGLAHTRASAALIFASTSPVTGITSPSATESARMIAFITYSFSCSAFSTSAKSAATSGCRNGRSSARPNLGAPAASFAPRKRSMHAAAYVWSTT